MLKFQLVTVVHKCENTQSYSVLFLLQQNYIYVYIYAQWQGIWVQILLLQCDMWNIRLRYA